MTTGKVDTERFETQIHTPGSIMHWYQIAINVRTDQSEKNGLFWPERDRHLNRVFIQRVNRGAAAMDSMRKRVCILNIKAC